MKIYVLLNLAVIVLEIIGLTISISARKWKIFVFYTQLSNIAALVSSICLVVCGSSSWTVLLRYISSCMLVMTFLITLFVLVPMGGGFKKLMISGNGIYHHTLCPILSVGSYLFLEAHCDVWLAPTLITLVYGLIMLYMNWKKLYDGPYPFFRVHNQSVMASVLWTIALFVLISGISLLVIRIAG